MGIKDDFLYYIGSFVLLFLSSFAILLTTNCKKRYSGLRDERLSSLAILHIYTSTRTLIDIDGVAKEFTRLKAFSVDILPYQ